MYNSKMYPFKCSTRSPVSDRTLCWDVAIVLKLAVIVSKLAPSVSQNTAFDFQAFNSSENLVLIGDAFYDKVTSAIYLNAAGSALQGQTCGKVLFQERVRLLDTSASGKQAVASFSTNFTFEITSRVPRQSGNHTTGDGFSFTFANDNVTNSGLPGGSMCLVNNRTDDGNPNNHVFAVEFDTFNNDAYQDPSNNHVGVDLHGPASTATNNLCGADINTNCSYFVDGGRFTAWVDYDGAQHTVEVRLAKADVAPRPSTPLISTKVDLSGIFLDYMYVGFVGSAGGSPAQVNSIKSWSFESKGMPEAKDPPPTINSPDSGRRRSVDVSLIAGVLAASTSFVLAGLGLCVYSCVIVKWQGAGKDSMHSFMMGKNYLLSPREFAYKELSLATNSFSDRNLLGSGGFGHVYKGTLIGTGFTVAVKRIIHESQQGEREFLAEICAIGQIRHRNLVQLHGWCREGENLLLVYEYMPNSSLDRWLFPRKGAKENIPAIDQPLPWDARHNIVTGLAAAVSYMHEEWEQCILHRDIKASNVMLDAGFNAHLGDFGLARLIDHDTVPKTTALAGTLGYLAPELPQTGKATKSSDVYSYGVLALEVACGRRIIDLKFSDDETVLLDCVWCAHEAGDLLRVADDRLGSVFVADEMRILLQLGLLSCHPDPNARPTMRLVHQCLIGEAPVPPLPASKPLVRYSLALVDTPDAAVSSRLELRVEAVTSSNNSNLSPFESSTISSPFCPG